MTITTRAANGNALITPPRPERPVPPKVEQIPVELREWPQWVLWRYDLRGDQWSKIPYQAKRPGSKAKADDPSTWASFDEAWDQYQLGGFDGIGYEFSADDPFFGVDVDKCLLQGRLLEWAVPIVGSLRRTYGEISPSGTGIKFIARGKLPGEKGTKRTGMGPDETGALELYDHGRYFALTGDVFGSASKIVDLQGAAATLYALAKDKKRPGTKPAPSNGLSLRSAFQTTTGDRRSPEYRARAYVFAPGFPDSIEGQDGHGRLYHVACVLVDGFGLRFEEAFPIFQDWNRKKAVPPEDD